MLNRQKTETKLKLFGGWGARARPGAPGPRAPGARAARRIPEEKMTYSFFVTFSMIRLTLHYRVTSSAATKQKQGMSRSAAIIYVWEVRPRVREPALNGATQTQRLPPTELPSCAIAPSRIRAHSAYALTAYFRSGKCFSRFCSFMVFSAFSSLVSPLRIARVFLKRRSSGCRSLPL